jgi:tRNA pseudouridine55 synthase
VVDRPVRQVHISKLIMDDLDLPEITFQVKCSKGTYVRTLCHDLGLKLGCGAHMTHLTRLASGPFELQSCTSLVKLQELARQGQPLPFISPTDALADWPAILIDSTVLKRLLNGIAPLVSDVSSTALKPGDKVKILSEDRLVATARYLPWDGSGQQRDFQLLKVFPNAEEGG